MKINLKRAGERKVLPTGDYIFTVDIAKEGESKKGQPKLHLELLCDDDEHPEYKGVRVFNDISLQEQSWFRVVELASACLGELEAENEEGDFELDTEALAGSQVAAHVEVDDSYDSVPRNKVTRYMAVDELFAPEPGEDKAEDKE